MDKIKTVNIQKSEFFKNAIKHRLEVNFLYELKPIKLHPYYLSRDKMGNKVVYGRVYNTNVIEKFEYKKIINIRINVSKRFTPIIPILSLVSWKKMDNENKIKLTDLLVEEFWKLGYTTVNRRYGKYLTPPSNIGAFPVDIIAQYNKNYAIGIILTNCDFEDKNLIEKINYLSNRQTKFTHRKVQLFIGVEQKMYSKIRLLLSSLNEYSSRNIKVIKLFEHQISPRRYRANQTRLFIS